MPRYVVERTFPEGLWIPTTAKGVETCLGIVDNNSREKTTWMHSYVSADRSKTFDIYDAPSPEAIRRAAHTNSLPVDTITLVRVLDPYFHLGGAE